MCLWILLNLFPVVLTCKYLHFLRLLIAYNSHKKEINKQCSWDVQHLGLNNEALSWYLSYCLVLISVLHLSFVFSLFRIPHPFHELPKAWCYRGAAVIPPPVNNYWENAIHFANSYYITSSQEPRTQWDNVWHPWHANLLNSYKPSALFFAVLKLTCSEARITTAPFVISPRHRPSVSHTLPLES